MTPAALRYYGGSLATLLRGVRNLPAVAWRLATRRGPDAPAIRVALAGGLRFDIRRALDLWVLKEVVLDGEYRRLGPEIAAGWTVVDIGAAHGEFAIPAALRVGAGREVATSAFVGLERIMTSIAERRLDDIAFRRRGRAAR
jgi:hypothetical protein